jgi:uncharacterized protein (TIGR02678 family)
MSTDLEPGPGGLEGPAAPRRARRWNPELGAEIAALLRLLAARPWLVPGRDDVAIAAVRVNVIELREVYARLGWVLVAERDVVRLRKSPPPRRSAWAADSPNHITCAWFFLLVAAAESLTSKVTLATLVAAARIGAAEAHVPTTGLIDERRAIVAALNELDRRGVIQRLDGVVEDFLTIEEPRVLFAVHHLRLSHVIANAGASDPGADPAAWLTGVEREPDPAVRMRRRLVDDAVVHNCDLDEDESDWLRRRVKGDDGGPLARVFGLEVERRAEGAAFVVPNEAHRYGRELGPSPFPVGGGTVAHAALLLCDAAALFGRIADDAAPGPGWCGLDLDDVTGRLARWAAMIGTGRGGWAVDLAENPSVLADKVAALLGARDLMRVVRARDASCSWWFSPATGRWPALPAQPATPRQPPEPAAPVPASLFDALNNPADEADDQLPLNGRD